MRAVGFSKQWAIVGFLIAAVLTGSAQYKQSGSAPFNDGMDWQLVKTGLYLISGQGGNSLLRLSGNGLIVVDGKSGDAYDALRKRIKKISDQPVKALILTDCDAPRSDTNAKFQQDGTPLVVQENAQHNFAACHAQQGNSTTTVLTYKDDYLIHLGGVDVHLMHFGNAFTSGDTVVYFPNLKVVAVGNLVTSSPAPDFAAGGSLADWGPVLEQVLKLDFDVAVPSSGPTLTKAELQSYKLKIDALTSRSKKLVAQGVPKDQFTSQLKADDLGLHVSYDAAQVDGLYAELSRTEQPTHEAQLKHKPQARQ